MENYVTKSIPVGKPEVSFVVRPWGSFHQYANNEEVTVSLMSVNAGQRLSLQSHTGRAELWIVLDEGAIVQVGDDILYPLPGAEVWIPANTRHRLSSGRNDDVMVRVLEVAFGNWQQEDIRRYEDDFARPQEGDLHG
ncbi:MAG: phosphomannose isomerase type II C-terminal cupin domain [Anaerolineae bacterium]|nr:phosphomannose isomerase type II C-terminal cupin domain [Anaerolineae bacterium]RIK24287.1 MAG: mannose-6-phosphate isomerase [Anaerolineae bacterium]